MKFIYFIIILTLSVSCVDYGTGKTTKSPAPTQVSEVQTGERLESSSPGKGQGKYRSGEILVKFREGTDLKTIEAIQNELHLKTIRLVAQPSLYLMEILDGSPVETMMKRLQEFQEVMYSEPNFIYTIN